MVLSRSRCVPLRLGPALGFWEEQEPPEPARGQGAEYGQQVRPNVPQQPGTPTLGLLQIWADSWAALGQRGGCWGRTTPQPGKG